MSLRVLVADDASTMRRIIIRSLEAIGISDVVEAEDGVEAVAMYAQGGFDLIITDWNMPHKDGMAVLQEIRSQDPDIPIVMVTTEAEKRRVLEAIRAGVSDYLIKPFTTDALREKLGRLVPV